MNVRDAMTTGVATVSPETPLKDAARVLFEKRISGLPVVDADGAVVGVISEGDFLLKEARGGTEHRSFWSRLLGREAHDDIALATTVGELMTAPAVTIEAGRSLHSAASLMAHRKINRLPVVEDGKLVGILTRADVVRAFVRSDEEIAEAVYRAIRAVDGLRLIEVRNGVVVLAGTIADASLGEAVRREVGEIDGVVALDDRAVAWRTPVQDISEEVAIRNPDDYFV